MGSPADKLMAWDLARQALESEVSRLRAENAKLREALAVTTNTDPVQLGADPDSALGAAIVARMNRLQDENGELRDLLAGGQPMKTHDLAMEDSWVIDDVDAIRAALKPASGQGGET